jgi:phytoene dehydrogenase-like protein
MSTSKTSISRRGFLRGAAGVAAGGLVAGGRGLAGAAPQASYKVTGWGGDEFSLAHSILRDPWAAKEPKTWKKHDVVVVGGGISGLTAAFKLRSMDLLLLETGSGLGGNARSNRHGGWEYNIGSAYIVGIEGEQGKLYGELGLKLNKVPHPLDRWHYKGQWIDDPWQDDGLAKLPDAFRKAMLGMRKAFRDLDGKDFPANPYEKSTAKSLALDKISFAEWAKPWAHPDLMTFLDGYCYGAMGAPAKTVSAFGGINFYADVIEERAYAWTEGNQHLIKVMAAAVNRAGAGRLQPGCTVYKVKPVSEDLARVYYYQNGESFGVETRRVVLATPYFVTARLIDGLSPSQKYALGCQRYCAYVVGNLCFDKVQSFEGYDSWAPTANTFEDYLPCGWPEPAVTKPRMEKEGQVIGAFACSHYPLLTRFRMMTQKPDAFAHRIVDDFEKLHPGSRQHLREVHMTRWGHAFIIDRPGVRTRWLPAIKKRIGPILLAHQDGQGLPAVEASTNEASAAAYAVLGGWKKRSG